ncbi:MAG: hypothetical protein K2P44_02005 [Lachnospiraceae bacterium]|nr:hypothetical protein [Lachnospiraceae bacterium]
MSKYIDEKIIREKNAYKAGVVGDIYRGVQIKEELYEFEPLELFEGQVSVYLPKMFEDMSEKLAILKYPMNSRPQIIKTNKNTDVNFSFNLIPQKIDNEDIQLFTEQMKKVIKTVQSATVFFDVKYIDMAGNIADSLGEAEHIVDGRMNISYFDYKSPAIDEQIYNFMFFAPLKETILHGVFNCRYRDADIWKDIFIQVTDSVRKIERDYK